MEDEERIAALERTVAELSVQLVVAETVLVHFLVRSDPQIVDPIIENLTLPMTEGLPSSDSVEVVQRFTDLLHEKITHMRIRFRG